MEQPSELHQQKVHASNIVHAILRTFCGYLGVHLRKVRREWPGEVHRVKLSGQQVESEVWISDPSPGSKCDTKCHLGQGRNHQL